VLSKCNSRDSDAMMGLQIEDMDERVVCGLVWCFAARAHAQLRAAYSSGSVDTGVRPLRPWLNSQPEPAWRSSRHQARLV
jgi:hypothetical protein